MNCFQTYDDPVSSIAFNVNVLRPYNLERKNFHALTRLDENRAKCQLAIKAGGGAGGVTGLKALGFRYRN